MYLSPISTIKIPSYILCFILFGCAQHTMYNPLNEPIDNLAVIECEDRGFWLTPYKIACSINTVYDNDGNALIRGNFMNGNPSMVQVPAGEFAIVFKCEQADRYAFVRAYVDVKKSDRKTAFCRAEKSETIEGVFGRESPKSTYVKIVDTGSDEFNRLVNSKDKLTEQ